MRQTISTNGFEQFINPQKICIDVYGSHGWIYSVWDYELQEYHYYRTNGYGRGLWVLLGREYKQVTGTCEYELPRDRKAAYNKIYYEWFVRQ